MRFLVSLGVAVLAASVVSACGKTSPGRASAPSPKPPAVDPSRLTARTDSFTILVGGQPRGHMRGVLSRESSDWVYTETTALAPMVQQRSVVRFGARGEMRSLEQSGAMGGRPMRIALQYSGGRVSGEAVTPTAPAPVRSDTTVPATVVDDNALSALIPALRFDLYDTIVVPVYAGGRGQLVEATYTREGVDTVTFGGVRVASWRVLETTAGQRSTLQVMTTAPYVVLSRAVQGAPFVLRREP